MMPWFGVEHGRVGRSEKVPARTVAISLVEIGVQLGIKI